MSATSAPRTSRRASSTTDLALIATFTALIAVCAQLTIPGVTSVPFTLQMFAIFLAAAVLGARRAFLTVVLYLVIGTAGLPVFTQGAAGPAVWTGASGGYLLAFPIAAFLVGLLATLLVRRNPAVFTAGIAIGAAVVTVAVVGTLGTLGMARALDVSLTEAWGFATPFFVADIIKGVLAAIVAAAVHRAFPQLLRR